MNNLRIRVIALYAGAGGLSFGFSKQIHSAFDTVWATDIDKDAAETYETNFGKNCLVYDIVDLLRNSSVTIPIADLVIGGPPCQGFSLLNKNRKDDVRRQLWKPFMEVVLRSEAKAFVMENVPGLLNSVEFEELKETARTNGFYIAAEQLCAADFGVPQVRKRAFVIGCKFTTPEKFFPPKRTHFDPQLTQLDVKKYVSDLRPWRTVRDAIGDLPPPIGTEIGSCNPPLNLHFRRLPTPLSLARYKAIPREGMNRFDLNRAAPHLTPDCWRRKLTGSTDIFGRLWWHRPSVTIRTEFFKPEKGRYLHPEQDRPITHREAARLQSFPDDFNFCGTKIGIAKQIGNAVPPLLSTAVANVIAEMFHSNCCDCQQHNLSSTA